MNDTNPISVNPEDSGSANLVYILYLLSLVLGITSIIGVVLAYINKDSAPEWVQSHYRNAIHVFWKGLLYGVICLITSFIFIGILLFFVLLIWYIVRVVKGMQMLSRKEAYPNPASWGF